MVVSDLYGSLIFGGVNSADYGIYISGEGVFNAPSRTVEFVSVPGRNGDVVLDQGRFDNIEVVYPAGTYATDQEGYRKRISDFRNAILSQKGYQKLTDSYHPDEYRMAIYVAGLEVSSVNQNMAGEFDLTFNCKPQRWLTEGESDVLVDSGDILENSTPFDAFPIVKTKGYGNLNLNGYDISIEDKLFGFITPFTGDSVGEAYSGRPTTATFTKEISFNGDTVASGDILNLMGNVVCQGGISLDGLNSSFLFNTYSIDSETGPGQSSLVVDSTNRNLSWKVVIPQPSFTVGTASTITQQLTIKYTYVTPAYSNTYYVTVTLAYDGASTITITIESDNNHQVTFFRSYVTWHDLVYPSCTCDSTASILGNPTYIDLELGETYKISQGEIISLNSQISLGSDLARLSPGNNTITFDNTFTEVAIVPRWWIV